MGRWSPEKESTMHRSGMTNEEHMRWGCLGMVAVIALVLLFFATQVGADEFSDRLAVAANHGMPGTTNDAEEIAAHNVVAQQLADAGVTVVRMRTLKWSDVQPTSPRRSKGGINWGKWPAIYEAYRSRGIKIVVFFGDTPDWALQPGQQKKGDRFFGTGAPRLRPWRQFVTAAARRFPFVHAWEVWNEPDIDKFFTGTPDQYEAMHRVAYAALKRNGQTVWGPAMTGHLLFDKPLSDGWVQIGRKALDGRLPVDAFSMHDYGTPEAKLEHAGMALALTDLRVHITETNVTWDRDVAQNLDPEFVADELERIYLSYATMGIHSIFWWGATTTGNGPTGLLDESYQPMPAYYRLEEMLHPIACCLTPGPYGRTP
jgi:GH35 family endo-1,4-beta-xylanase